MPMYSCEPCGFSNVNRSKYVRHLSSKKHMEKGGSGAPDAVSMELEKKEKELEYEKKKNERQQKQIERQQKQIEEQENEIERRQNHIERQQHRMDVLIEQLKIQNIIRGDNNTITNTINNIQFICYQDAGVCLLSLKDYMKVIKKVNSCVKCIDHVHFNPSNPQNQIIMVYESNKWTIMNNDDERAPPDPSDA